MELKWIDPPPQIGRGMTGDDVRRLLDLVDEGEGQWALAETFKAPSAPSSRIKSMTKALGDDAELLAKYELRGAKLDDATRHAAGAPDDHTVGLWARARR